jgi:hypothetical protein
MSPRFLGEGAWAKGAPLEAWVLRWGVCVFRAEDSGDIKGSGRTCGPALATTWEELADAAIAQRLLPLEERDMFLICMVPLRLCGPRMEG